MAGCPSTLAGDAHHDLGVIGGEDAAGEDALEACHDMVGGLGAYEADVEEVGAPHFHELVFHAGWCEVGFFLDGLVGALGEEEFVAEDEDSLGEVERDVGGVGGYLDEVGAEGDLFVEEAFVLAPEDDGDFSSVRKRGKVGSPFAGRLAMLAVESTAGGRADDGDAVGDGLFEGGAGLALFEDGVGVDGHDFGFLPIDGLLRRDNGEVV